MQRGASQFTMFVAVDPVYKVSFAIILALIF